MKGVRIIAVLQIVLAIVFAVIAWQMDPGVSKLSDQFAGTCHELAGTVRQHKDFYADSMRNIFPLKNSLKELGDKTGSTAKAFVKTGETVDKKPIIGRCAPYLKEMGRSLQTVSDSLTGQASVLAKYEGKTFQETQAAFDRTAESLQQAEQVLRYTSTQSKLYIQLLVALSSLIFLMNAIALLLIAGKKGSDSSQNA